MIAKAKTNVFKVNVVSVAVAVSTDVHACPFCAWAAENVRARCEVRLQRIRLLLMPFLAFAASLYGAVAMASVLKGHMSTRLAGLALRAT